MIFCIYAFGFLLYSHAISFAQQPSAEELLKDLACGSCHSGINVESDILEKAPDLNQVGLRLTPDFIFSFMQFPTKLRQNIGFSRMPNYHLDEKELLAITLFLQQQVPEGSELPNIPDQKIFEKAKSDYPDVDAKMGEKIIYSQNCVACHKLSSIVPWQKKNAPDLSFEGFRVKREWLAEFLTEQKPIRPFGFYPGSGSRHPDFRLSESEVATLTDYFVKQNGNFDFTSSSFEQKKLTVFSMAKAQKLLKDKFSCLGCHQLGNDGGRIGPDLSSIKTRLQPDFVYQFIRNPKSIMPETIMPKIEMPEKTLNLIVNYLLQQEVPSSIPAYLSLIDNLPINLEGLDKNQSLYMNYCSSCHGANGDGAGYNARFLPATPTKHADASHMTNRPDDTLFDGIYAGGYILNKSHRMPPWGSTLERKEIWQLVTFMRQLCQCQGPAWSRDNK